MEIDSTEEAKILHVKCNNLIDKFKNKLPLTTQETEDAILILSKASYEFYEASE